MYLIADVEATFITWAQDQGIADGLGNARRDVFFDPLPQPVILKEGEVPVTDPDYWVNVRLGGDRAAADYNAGAATEIEKSNLRAWFVANGTLQTIPNRHPDYPGSEDRYVANYAGGWIELVWPIPTNPKRRHFSASPVLGETVREFVRPPLFITAYMDPTNPDHQGQEELIARYAMALVAQDDRVQWDTWRDDIRALNPDITLLAYMMVNEETTVPGPGHDIVRAVPDPWIRYPDGSIPENNGKRLIDTRKVDWQEAFVQGCEAVMADYPYQGMFLDNCTIFNIHHPEEEVREECRQALQVTMTALREALPAPVILIGNAVERWEGLNGGMNEGRPEDLLEEAVPTPNQSVPVINLFQHLMFGDEEEGQIAELMNLAIDNEVMFGAAFNFQTAYWNPLFDDVKMQWKWR